jgi:hypothetical protein
MLANTQYTSPAAKGLNYKFIVREIILIGNSLTSFNTSARLWVSDWG